MDNRAAQPDSTRFASIDVLRGFAIVWVILFHLWGDLEFFPGAPRVYYHQLADQWRDNAGPLAIFTSFTPAALGAQTSGTVGERAQGMGGAFVAVADDASAIYWNPAGLAWPTGSTFDAQVSVADDIFFLAAALPSLGLSYYRLPIVLTSGGRQNERAGEVPIRTLITNNVGVTLNQTVGKGLVIGTTLRLVRGGIDGCRPYGGA